MEEKDESNIIVDVRLMKIIGLYQLLRSHGPNVFVWMAVAEVVVLVVTLFALVMSMIHCLDDANKCAEYLLLILAAAMTVFKLYTVMRYRDAIWTCVRTTRIDHLSYGRHRTRILESGRSKVKSMSSAIGTFRINLLAVWILSPFVLWGQFTEVKYDGDRTRRYRMNVLNLVFPVDGVSYDGYFAVSYLAESISIIVYSHVELTFDVLIIALCIAASYQLMTIADSFANLGAVRQSPTCGKS